MPFSWKALGVDIRGRSQTLRINYRTSHQIRAQADRLLPAELSDVDGNVESRAATVSAFSGPDPTIQAFPTAEDEARAVASWLIDQHQRRGHAGGDRHLRAIGSRASPGSGCGFGGEPDPPLSLTRARTSPRARSRSARCTFAKGMEFRVVVVAACDDEIVPLQARIEAVTDDADLEEVYNTERHLLYVACTRARDNLLITGVEPVSEFLDDLCSS